MHDLAALGEAELRISTASACISGFCAREDRRSWLCRTFTRFLSAHRQSADLEAEIRTDLRREGLAGAIEIILHHEAREIG